MRRQFFLLSIVVVLLGVVVAAATFEQITVANTAIGFTAAKIDPVGGPQMNVASCRLETAEVRFSYDGTTPTSSVGTLLEIGDVFYIAGHDQLLQFRAIRTGASSGQLDCHFDRVTQR